MSKAALCENCNHSSLSLLFVRPSPIVKSGPLVATGSAQIVSDSSLLTDLLPAVLPTQSRFALRLLRAGYIHIYIANPPSGVNNWLVYRVTENADIIAEANAIFSSPDNKLTCTKSGHNKTGYKLVAIPQAHKIAEIWVAFTANIWNKTLREKNKENSKVMQRISLQNFGQNCFKPTVENLKSKVLECALGKLSINGSDEHDFPFISVANEIGALADNLKNAALAHPKTAGKEMAVVLRDPVGIACELNALRIRRNELVKKEFAKPENAHPLNSSNTILGLRQTLVSEEDLKSYEEITPMRTNEAFLKETWPAGTEWQKFTKEDREQLLKATESSGAFLSILTSPYKKMFERKDLGRVFYPDHDSRAAAWTKKKVEKNWKSMERYYDDNERRNWVSNFQARMKKEHYDAMFLFETDWRAAADDVSTSTYFKSHFDPAQEYSEFNAHNPFLAYTRENASINAPAPFSEGLLLIKYLEGLLKEVDGETSVAWRGIVANNASLLTNVHVQLTGDPGVGMRDKTYDFAKGVTELKVSHSAMKAHGWISTSLMFYSFSQYAAIGSALTLVAGGKLASTVNIPPLMGKVATLGMVQQFMESAVQGAFKSGSSRMPLLVTMAVPVSEALTIFSERVGQNLGTSKTKIKANSGGSSTIVISVLTDTVAYEAANGNLASIAHDPNSGIVKIGGNATRQAVSDAAGNATVISSTKLLRLYRDQAGAGAKIANLLHRTASDVGYVLKSTEARLAIGSMIVQSIGLWNASKQAMKAKADGERDEAYVSMLDSGLGLTAGALQLAGVAVELSIVRSLGQQAAEESFRLGSMKMLGSLTGVAGAIISFNGARKKKNEEEEHHDYAANTLYFYSTLAFGGTIGTSTLLTVGTVAGVLEGRAIGGIVVRTVATRLAANAAIATIGEVAITISGVGLLLTGAAILFQVGAIVLTPTDVQRWLGRSFFGRDGGVIFSGKRDDMFVKGDWLAEKAELEKIFIASEATRKERIPS